MRFIRYTTFALLVALSFLVGAEALHSLEANAGDGAHARVSMAAPDSAAFATHLDCEDGPSTAPCDLCRNHFGHSVGLVSRPGVSLVSEARFVAFISTGPILFGYAPQGLIRPPRARA